MTSECIFCKIVAGTAESWKIHETQHACAFLDIHPVADYHALVIPKQHSRDIFDATSADLLAVASSVKCVVDLYREKLGMQNVQVLNSSGREAQQDVLHLHFHVIPRQSRDGLDWVWPVRNGAPARFDELLVRLK